MVDLTHDGVDLVCDPSNTLNTGAASLGGTTAQPLSNPVVDDANLPMYHSENEHPDWPDPESPLYHPISHVHTPDSEGYISETPSPTSSPPPSPTPSPPNTDLDVDANVTSATPPRQIDPESTNG